MVAVTGVVTYRASLKRILHHTLSIVQEMTRRLTAGKPVEEAEKSNVQEAQLRREEESGGEEGGEDGGDGKGAARKRRRT